MISRKSENVYPIYQKKASKELKDYRSASILTALSKIYESIVHKPIGLYV